MRICFATDELFPAAPGGIGRMLHNMLRAHAGTAEMHVLAPRLPPDPLAALAAACEGLATLHLCPADLRAVHPRFAGAALAEAVDACMAQSLGFLAALLEPGSPLCLSPPDVLEFPDFRGWAAAPIAAKRAGLGLAGTRIVVRVHSTAGIIADHEPFAHPATPWAAATDALERQALRDADLVVAHLPAVADHVARHYGFDAAWRAAVRIEAPPITLTPAEAAAAQAPPPAQRDFLFASRLQPFKRPDLFIRAAVHLLDTDPSWERDFILRAGGHDAGLAAWLRMLVPARHAARIRFEEPGAPEARAIAVAHAIAVVPSDHESLCLFAFEAAMLGAPVILNRRCVAFAAEPWRDGENCLLFDGDHLCLAAAMRRARGWCPAGPPAWPAHLPHWQDAALAAPSAAALPDLAVLLHGGDAFEAIEAAVDALAGPFPLHVLVPHGVMAARPASIALWALRGVTAHGVCWPDAAPAEIMGVVRGLAEAAVAFAEIGGAADAALWPVARRALAQAPGLDAVTGHLLLGGALRFCWGAAPRFAAAAARVAHRGSVFRRATLLRLGLRDQAGDRWHEDLCARLVQGGGQVLVVPGCLAVSQAPATRIDAARFAAGIGSEPFEDGAAALDTHAWRARLTAREARAEAGRHIPSAHAEAVEAAPDPAHDLLELTITGLRLEGRRIARLGCKLLLAGGGAVELRAHHHVEVLLEAWPTTHADAWGPVALLGAPAGDPRAEIFARLAAADAALLAAFAGLLPDLVRAAWLPAAERPRWLALAEALAARHGSTG